MCFVCRKRVTHFRFVYYVVGHCKMILLQILGPFLPFVEFLEIFCPSSKFRKSVAFRSGSESFRLSSTNKVLEFFCNYGWKSASIVLTGRKERSMPMVSWMAVPVCLNSFLFLPSFSFKLSSISLSLSLCLSLSLVLFLLFCFCLF